VVKEKTVIGRREIADLPEFGLYGVSVKIDTGAYTSSIHVKSYKEINVDNKLCLAVVFLDESYPAFNAKEFIFETYRLKKVKSSTGQEQMRYFVKGSIIVGGRNIKTEFSITKRNGMKYPILLGRKVLNKKFIVDTELVNTSKKK
jgi:hypothetical protein